MDGFLANIKQRRERDPSVCINCGVKPRDDGYQYCSKECAREAQAKLLGKVAIPPPPAPAPAPAPAPPPPADDSDDSDGSVLSDPNLCEECHRRPKHYDSARGILYQFCGRGCRDTNALREAQPHCKLKGCKKTFNSNDDYCSQEHAQEAVRRGEAKACPVCDVNPVSSGFKHCSRECALKQANQPKLNGPSRSGSSNFGPSAYPGPPPALPGNRGSLPPPPPPAVQSNVVDKDADAPMNSSPGPCEHCGTRPKSVKVHRHCSKECAKAARAGRKGAGSYGDSDEDSWPEDAARGKAVQRPTYDDDDDDGWGSAQSPMPQQPQVNPANSKTYTCCNCTITVTSGSPPAECPICKLAQVKRELEAEKAKPPVVIRIPQSPAPAPAPAPTPPAPVQPAAQPPAPNFSPALAPQPKPIQPNPLIRPGAPIPLPGMRKVTPSPAPPPPPPQPQQNIAKQPVNQPTTRRQLDEEEEDEEDDSDEEFFVRQPEPAPVRQAPPVTVESDDDDDDFFVR